MKKNSLDKIIENNETLHEQYTEGAPIIYVSILFIIILYGIIGFIIKVLHESGHDLIAAGLVIGGFLLQLRYIKRNL